jgi:excinuclease UvrABC nuclease subunit
LTPDGSIAVSDLEHGDDALLALPQAPAVFLISAGEGRPYLARTSVLRRRALRLLARRDSPARSFHLREAFSHLDYWLTGSALDASMRMYDLARGHFPDEYARMLRLRMPPYVKLLLANAWPRSIVTTHFGGGASLLYGPFRSRLAAEQFESEFLDLFQIRRCMMDLAPAADHPGCIYGEMNKCLRPCQLAVGHQEYQSEVTRAREFLETGGRSLLRTILTARDQLSAEMEFEEAARQHRRMEKVEEVLKMRDALAANVNQLHAVAVTRSATPNTVDLFLLRAGHWQGGARIGFELEDGKPVSIDRKLRDVWATAPEQVLINRERQERLAVLARWFYSTWCDGELLVFPDFNDPPVRKLVNAISRVSGKRTPDAGIGPTS